MDAEKMVVFHSNHSFLSILHLPWYLNSRPIHQGWPIFSPGNSSYQYLGIWYVKVTKQTVIWVANRNDPINDSSGVLSINLFGNLILHDSYNRVVWSTNISVQGTTSSVAQLQDSGNLVLAQGNNKKVLWQSFDYLTDTLLPCIRLGWIG